MFLGACTIGDIRQVWQMSVISAIAGPGLRNSVVVFLDSFLIQERAGQSLVASGVLSYPWRRRNTLFHNMHRGWCLRYS